MHSGKQLEAHWAQKGCLIGDSDAPQVGSARSDWTGVLKVNRRKTDRRKMRPYRIQNIKQCWYNTYVRIKVLGLKMLFYGH